MSKLSPLGQADYRLGFGESGEYERPSMSKQATSDWVETGQAAEDQRLEPVYWRTRVFRNSYVRAGKLHRVRGWSAKIQHQGVRRTISLGAVDQEVAAEKAAAIFAQIQQSGWASIGKAARPAVPVVATGLESDDPRESADYWRLRLVERKYPANRLAKPEFSCRIEHDGAGCYFPLGTLNEVQAAEQALEVYRCVLGGGWEAAARFRRELTLALIWAGSPFCCTYLTIHSLSGKTKRTANRPKTDTGKLNVYVVDPDPTVAASIQKLVNQAARYCCRETFADIDSLGSLGREDEPGLLLVNRGMPGFSGEELDNVFKRKFPDCPVVPFATFEDSEQLFDSTAGSLNGYFLNRTPTGELFHLLEDESVADANGLPRLNPATIDRLVRRYFKNQIDTLATDRVEETFPHLTPREHEVMTHLSRGALDKEIADLLSISIWTVHNHLKNIYEKLGVQNRTEAVMEYLQK